MIRYDPSLAAGRVSAIGRDDHLVVRIGLAVGQRAPVLANSAAEQRRDVLQAAVGIPFDRAAEKCALARIPTAVVETRLSPGDAQVIARVVELPGRLEFDRRRIFLDQRLRCLRARVEHDLVDHDIVLEIELVRCAGRGRRRKQPASIVLVRSPAKPVGDALGIDQRVFAGRVGKQPIAGAGAKAELGFVDDQQFAGRKRRNG